MVGSIDGKKALQFIGLYVLCNTSDWRLIFAVVMIVGTALQCFHS